MPFKDFQTTKFWYPAAVLLAGCAGLALLTWIGVAFEFNHPATGALLYLIDVVLVSMTGNIAAGIGVAIIAVFCLSYFFTEPRFDFRIDATEDVVAVTAFALTAVIIANLVGRARRLGEGAALKDRLQLIIDTIPAMVWSISPDGSADFMNKRFRDYTGLSLEDIRGWAWTDALHRAWMDALHPEDRAMDAWRAALAPGKPFEREARLRSSDGEYRRFLLRFVPLSNERGSIVEWYADSTDIEDLRRTEEELHRREARLRDAQMELAHANRVTTTGQLAASIVHEVSQPISAALTNASAACRWLDAEPPELEEVRQALGRIVRDGRRATDIIGRIRALVRKAPPRNDQLDINETILEVVALTNGELRRSGTSLETELADGLPLILGDRIQLQQVVLNLILNAVEAMSRSNEPARELRIRTELDGPGSVLVAVQDSGPGLEPESSGAALRRILHNQGGRHGYGAIDLPFDHRGACRPRLGHAKPTPGRGLSIHAASASHIVKPDGARSSSTVTQRSAR